jgi:plasmid stabilization system protein ParE
MTGGARNSVRVDTRRRLLELVRHRAQTLGAQCEYGTPPDGIAYGSVWFGDISGETTVADMRAGRKARNDEFSIEVHAFAFVTGDETGEAADRAVEELAGAVDDVLADDPSLGGTVPGLSWVRLDGPANGPNAFRTDEGHGSYRTLSVACLSRLV